ncbi:YggT family protein [Pediococcus inopinatus]|nr:YggT family protein [Pediococcus inopinatus]AVL01075.1 YggT family protein [Pediococcus inopinatus]WPC20594.1 YggT family protein [Pediococcus inopinatus]WPP10191.1 YggT family protein [Pediococcus inopinatus]
MLLIFVFVLMSWFPGAYQTKLGQWLIKLCMPYLKIFRFIPPFFGLDFSPIVAILLLEMAQYGIAALSSFFY